MQLTADGKARRTSAEWNEIFDRFDESQLSRDQFCKQEHLQSGTFARWHRKLRGSKPRNVKKVSRTMSPATPTQFVEIAAPQSSPSPWSVELELPGGCVLRLRA